MITVLWAVGLLFVLAGLYLWAMAPAGEPPPAIHDLCGEVYAHRGFHDKSQSIPENSLAAFQRAVDFGYGIELDVQSTQDGQLVVFHDATLQRMCGSPLPLLSLSYKQLQDYPLPDGNPIPLLSQVLALVKGQVPLVVEIKHYGSATQNAALAWQHLKEYQGKYCVESFHPLAMRYFRRQAPHIVRGQLANGSGYTPGETNRLTYFAMKYLLMNAISRPHFVAYSFPGDRNLSMWLMKYLFRPPLAAWTLRTQQQLDASKPEYQMPIFEGFFPGVKDM